MSGMNPVARKIFLIVAASLILLTPAMGQGPARGKIEESRDPILETAAKHNLEVARWSISKRKAYGGAVDRLQEIIDTHPDFSRMDEVLFWMGEAHLKLDKPDKAVGYLDKLVKDYPGSEFIKKARERLGKLKENEGKGVKT